MNSKLQKGLLSLVVILTHLQVHADRDNAASMDAQIRSSLTEEKEQENVQSDESLERPLETKETIDLLKRPSLRFGTKEEYFSLINDGWPKAYSDVEKALKKDRNYIVISLVFPRKAMDLRSSEHFQRSYFLHTETESKDGIGHSIVGWQCRKKDGSIVRGMTGFTGENDHQYRRMLKLGWGAAVFTTVATDGYLQTPHELTARYKRMFKKKDDRAVSEGLALV